MSDPRQFDPQALAAAAGVQRMALEGGRSVWISANAGTGKTEVLTQRMLALLLEDATLEPRQLLALTFTKAGAAEMAARLPERLADWARLDDAALAAKVEATLGFAPEGVAARVRELAVQVRTAPPLVATIHALAQQLLTRFAVEAGMEPGFEVMEEGAQRRLLAEVQHRLLVGVDGPLAESLAVLLDELGEHRWRDVSNTLANDWRKLRERLAQGGPLALLARAKAALDLREFNAAPLVPTAEEWAVLHRVAAALPGHAVQAVVRARRADMEAAWRGFVLTGSDTPRKLSPWFKKDELAKLDDADVAVLVAASERVAEGVRLKKAWRCYEVTQALVVWAAAVKAAYDAEKRMRGVADYDDLLDGLERLLQRADAGLAQWLWYGFDRRFRHLLVDEGQDNNPQQDRIVQWLARNILSGDVGESSARTVLAVGDVKQSIFRFQGAAPELFVSLREALEAWAAGFAEVDLTHSFRSAPEILAVVDGVFDRDGLAAQVMGGDDRAWPGHKAVAAGRPGRVELWPLVEALPGEESPWMLAWERAAARGDGADIRLFRQVAAWLEDKLGSVVVPSTGLPLRPEDILIVVQTNKVAALAAGVLRRAGLPVCGSGGIPPLAVQDVVALVRVVFNPADTLALAQVLKAFRHWDDARLLALAARAGKDGAWFEALEGEDRTWLDGWLARAWEAPLSVVHAAAAARGGGRAMYEGLLGWAAACASLRELVMRREQEDLPVSGGGEGVRILTVQKSKGLQAPLVIVPETLRSGQVDTLLWGEDVVLFRQGKGVSRIEDALIEAEDAKREADSLRGLYVALTRASDWLVVAGFGSKKDVSRTWWGRVEAAGGWREAEGVRVRGQDFARVEKQAAEAAVVEAPAWMGAAVPPLEAAAVQSPAQARGELVHALLQGLELPAEPGVVAEAMAVRAALPWVFEHGRSEVSVALGDGNVGRIDRLVEHDGVLWVIDFKTGEVPAAVPPAYVAQVAGYVAAVRMSHPGRTVRGAVVWTASATLAEVA